MYFLAIVLIAVPFYRLGGEGVERYKINLVKDPHDAKLSLCHLPFGKKTVMFSSKMGGGGGRSFPSSQNLHAPQLHPSPS
jgi:hypothetical protein